MIVEQFRHFLCFGLYTVVDQCYLPIYIHTHIKCFSKKLQNIEAIQYHILVLKALRLKYWREEKISLPASKKWRTAFYTLVVIELSVFSVPLCQPLWICRQLFLFRGHSSYKINVILTNINCQVTEIQDEKCIWNVCFCSVLTVPLPWKNWMWKMSYILPIFDG